MEHAVFLRIVVKAFCPFISQGIAGAISGSGNNALDLSSSLDGVMKMKNRHVLPLPEAGASHCKVYKRAFLFLSGCRYCGLSNVEAEPLAKWQAHNGE